MKNNPLVTVIIPTYNRDHLLATAIESALQQTYTHTQIIVVDDGSTDKTAQLVKKYPQVEYVLKEHSGQAATRNWGLRLAKGSIVASLDSDDIWSPAFLERCVSKLEEEQCDLVFANWYQCGGNSREWDFLSGDPHIMKYYKKTPDHWVTMAYADARALYVWDCPSPSSSVVMRKSSIVNEWDEKINIGDDWAMYLSMILAKECKIAFTLDKLWKKRVDACNIYDGRVRCEILKYLYIDDTQRIIETFRGLLTKKEMKVFRRRYIGGLEELAKHEILREHNVNEFMRLFKVAFAVDVYDSLVMIPVTIMEIINRKILYMKTKQLVHR